MKVSKEFIIGVVVVLTIAVLYMGVNYLKGINLLAKQLKFYAVYENVAGLTASNAVVLNGYKIGIVKKVGMHPRGDGSLVVEIIINDSDLKLPLDTKLEIFDADLFGGKAIRIAMGDSAVYAADKDTLGGTIALGLTESIKQEIEPLKKKTSELFAGIDSVITSLNLVLGSANEKQGLSAIFSSLKNTMQNLESSTSKFDQLLTENTGKLSDIFTNVESITENLKNNNETLTKAITNIGTLSDTLAKLELATTILRVNKALGSFEEVMTKINEGTGTVGQLVNNDSLHTELVNASHSLDLLLNDMRIHPKRYVSFSLIGRKEKTEAISKKDLETVKDAVKENK
jgi:phospholipid/cholesterol/gamma-HCH transport system substrate-binding protein